MDSQLSLVTTINPWNFAEPMDVERLQKNVENSDSHQKESIKVDIVEVPYGYKESQIW